MSAIGKPITAWAMFAPKGWIFHESVRRTRGEVVEFANTDAAPTWTWEKYRKRGFYIAKVEVRQILKIGSDT